MAIDGLGSGIEKILHDVAQGPVATVQVSGPVASREKTGRGSN